MTANILIVGDSHTHALKGGLKTIPQNSASLQVLRYARLKNEKPIGDLAEAKILELVAGLGRDDLVVSCIGGNQHQTLALIQHPQPFDVMLPDRPNQTLDEGLTLVPYRQLFDLLEQALRGKDGGRLTSIRKVARCPVFHLLPPPPKDNVEHLLAKHETTFAEAGIRERGITPAATRLKIWQIQSAVLGKLAQEWGIGLLPPPQEALTSEGFLAPDCYAGDATHGNQRYGALVLQQILELVNQAANTR